MQNYKLSGFHIGHCVDEPLASRVPRGKRLYRTFAALTSQASPGSLRGIFPHHTHWLCLCSSSGRCHAQIIHICHATVLIQHPATRQYPRPCGYEPLLGDRGCLAATECRVWRLPDCRQQLRVGPPRGPCESSRSFVPWIRSFLKHILSD